MFGHCSYHMMDSVLPLSAEEELYAKEKLLRLEHICACEIVKGENNCQTLSKTPTFLYKILWEAYLTEEYYAKDSNLVGIQELLYHWPQEEFVLKNVMPKFPARRNIFTYYPEGSYQLAPSFYGRVSDLRDFYQSVVRNITDTLKECNKIHKEQHAHETKVRKIDISGFYIFDTYFLSEFSKIKYPLYRKIEIEVILDVNSYNDPELIFESHDYIVPRFRHVSLTNAITKDKVDDIEVIERMIDNNGTISLKLDSNIVAADQTDVLKTLSKASSFQENIQSLHISWVTSINSSSLKFLQCLKNLVHLHFHACSLNGLLEPLKHMQRGLLYLNMCECQVEDEDLIHLIGSCHQSTLRELNLADSSLSYDIRNSKSLIELFSGFKNIVSLNLMHCGLNSWPSYEIALLCDSFKLMPNIIHLELSHNYFTADTILSHIMTLQENTSLRYLELQMPEDVVKSQRESFCVSLNQKMNSTRSQLLKVDIC